MSTLLAKGLGTSLLCTFIVCVCVSSCTPKKKIHYKPESGSVDQRKNKGRKEVKVIIKEGKESGSVARGEVACYRCLPLIGSLEMQLKGGSHCSKKRAAFLNST